MFLPEKADLSRVIQENAAEKIRLALATSTPLHSSTGTWSDLWCALADRTTVLSCQDNEAAALVCCYLSGVGPAEISPVPEYKELRFEAAKKGLSFQVEKTSVVLVTQEAIADSRYLRMLDCVKRKPKTLPQVMASARRIGNSAQCKALLKLLLDDGAISLVDGVYSANGA